MRRRFVQDRETGELRELPPSYAQPVHRDTIGAEEVPSMVETVERNNRERERNHCKQRKQDMVRVVNQHLEANR